MRATDMKPSLPVGDGEPRVDRIGDRTIAEAGEGVVVSLATRRGCEADLRRRAAGLLGEELPPPGRMTSGGAWTAVWTGPERWMLIGRERGRAAGLEEVATAVGDAGSITDQSDGMARFTLDGDRLAEMLERLCDIDAARMAEGDARRTVIEHVGVTVLVHSPRRLTFLSPRSYARSLHEALIVAARATAP